MAYNERDFTEYDVKTDIRDYYRSAYQRKAEQQHPWLNRVGNALMLGGIGLAGLGVFGVIGAGAVVYFSLPYVWPVIGASVASFVTGGGSFLKSLAIGGRIDRVRDQLLDADIANYTLVKSYLQDVLPAKTKEIQHERETVTSKRSGELFDLTKRQDVIDRKRKLGLSILRDGFAALERQIDASLQEIEKFKRDASETLGESFDAAAAQKQQPAPAAGQSAPRTEYFPMLVIE